MLRLTIIVTLLYCLTSCSNSDNKPVVIDSRISPPEPDKDLREKYDAEQKVKASACLFENPDTSLSNIKLRDAESATTILKVKRLNGDTAYNFSTRDKNETLSVTVHPGDYYSQVSIFRVKYSDNKTLKATALSIDHFTTEKNIKLGLTKKEVVALLGHCYSTSDSTNKRITINYRLESPQDSRTRVLQRQNMPIYYGTYQFKKDTLVEFEFGFEYP
jgi:hypothetical protein